MTTVRLGERTGRTAANDRTFAPTTAGSGGPAPTNWRPSRRRFSLLLLLLSLVTGLLSACSTEPTLPAAETRPPGEPVRIASFDFAESEVLAELYAAALRRSGVQAEVVSGLGTREVVAPALEQGLVDVVPEYAGTALEFYSPGNSAAEGSTEQVVSALRTQLRLAGITVLDPAAAEDKNGFAMNADTARQLGVATLSDLKPLAAEMAFAGPPECRSRRYCMAGLQEMYGLQFARFEPMSRPATEEALLSGEVDVGMLETTDPRLASGRLVLLADDLQLQPAENVVPFVRTAVMEQVGDRVAAALQLVSSQLRTEDLIELNRQVQLKQRPPAAVANDWLLQRIQ